MKKLKILNVYKTFSTEITGGVEQAIKQLSIALNKKNIDSAVLFLSNNKNIKSDDLTIYRSKLITEIYSCSIGTIEFFKKLNQLQNKFDLIIFHYPWPFADLSIFFSKIRIPYIIFYHSDIIRQKKLEYIYSPLRSIFFEKAKKIICTSPQYLQTSKLLQKWKFKVEVVPLFINNETINYDSEIEKNVKNLSSKNNFLFIGKNRSYKGINILYEAFKRLKQIKLKIIGFIDDKVSLPNVEFLGEVSDYEKYHELDSCKALILPSTQRNEAFGYVLLEAAYFKKPLITTKIGSGTSFVNINNETGFEIEPNSVEQLCDAIEKMENNLSITRKFSQNISQRYNTVFDSNLIINKFLNIFDQIKNH